MTSNNKLIILDFPNEYKFGMDLRVWTIGPNFRGIKDIPDGCHYIYYSCNEEVTNTAFFIHLKGGQVVVKKWSKVDAILVDYQCSEADLMRFNENKNEIDCHLGKYYKENHKEWWSLSNYLSVSVIDALMPDCGSITSGEQFESLASNSAERMKSPVVRDIDGLIEMTIKPETVIHFTQLPKFLFPEGATDRTKYLLDKTYTLESIMAPKDLTKLDLTSILGELQFAYVTYNLSHHLSALEQWLGLIDLLSWCSDAVTKYPLLYSSFFTVLYHQLKVTDEDFADITTSTNRFYGSMRRLFDTVLDQGNITDELKTRAQGLKKTLEEKYDWDFDEELDDERPVMVVTEEMS